MEKDIVEIREEQLDEVTGGTHLTPDELMNLKPWQELIIENNFGQNIARVQYLGEWRDPGAGSMLQARVQVLQIYDRGTMLHGDTFSSWVGERRLAPGDKIYVSRYYLDFPYRA